MIALRPFALALLGAVLVLLPACQNMALTHGTSASAEAAIRALDESFPRWVERREYHTLVESYYTADAVLLPPNARAIIGRAAIEATLSAWPPITNFVMTVDEVVVSGELAYSRGTYSMMVTPPGAAPTHDAGKFLEILRREPSGGWKVSREMFNSDLLTVGR